MTVGAMRALLRKEMGHDLLNNVLPYWMEKMVDHDRGGFYGRRDGYDALDPQAEKGIILNARILWTFSHAARVLAETGVNAAPYIVIADRAYHYIIDHFADTEKGGVYWMVDASGGVSNTKKQIYAQAFAIYAFTEYFLATRHSESLQQAIRLFQLIEQHSFDRKFNGYFEAFDRDWNLLTDLRLSEKDANEKKSMNTHLHVLEAYTNLYRCWKDQTLKQQLQNLIVLFKDTILDSRFHFQLFFSEEWEVRSHEISFGHDIEGSWLLYEAAAVLADESLLKQIAPITVRMVDVAVDEGLDRDGGLMNEANLTGVSDTDKHWWPQAEAIVGLVNAWQLTHHQRYLQEAVKVWSFIKDHLIDEVQGEWHWRVNRDGNVYRNEDKAGFWKCPYHNGRAALEIMTRLR
ncbi:MAG TPA: AGE family epimerase/isomerase [Ohtaekwangia sp.]|nr:AGE family epimerase/isomerase [Ohtaekwangia sp.]